MPRRKRPPGVRVVHYELGAEVTLSMEILLERGKAEGTIVEGDCSSTFIWFEGAPGPAMRAFRKEMPALAATPALAGGTPESARLVRMHACTGARRESLGR